MEIIDTRKAKLVPEESETPLSQSKEMDTNKSAGGSSQKDAFLDPSSYRSIWTLGSPVMINMGAHTAFALIDLYWIGSLGTDAIAAVSLCGNILFSMFGLTTIVYAGALAMITRRMGAQNFSGPDGVEGISAQSIHFSFVLGAIIGSAGVYLSQPIVGLFDASPAITDLGTSYLVPMMASFLPIFTIMAFSSIFTAAGDTRTPMYIGVGVNILNAILDPFLIFGWAGFPKWGVAGAGIASLICQILCVVVLWIAFRYKTMPFPKPGVFSWYGIAAWKTILRIGVPGSIAMLTRPFSTLFLLKIIAAFGAAGLAAFGITIRALSPTWLFHGAITTAVSTLTGQSLGRNNITDIRLLVSKSLRLSMVVSIVMGSIYFIWAREIIGIFEKNSTQVLDLGTMFLQLLVVANLASAFSVVWGAVMNGAGDTRSPMIIAFLANWIIKLPLAYVLAITFDIGIKGIWWAMFISLVFESAAILIWYKRGRWKHVKV